MKKLKWWYWDSGKKGPYSSELRAYREIAEFNGFIFVLKVMKAASWEVSQGIGPKITAIYEVHDRKFGITT
ncbi:hypothetical protein ACLD72_027265 [Paenibacillus sp. TH7-28]